MTEQLYTIPQVAEVLGVSLARAYDLARRGWLPAVRIGRQVRVDPEALAAWIREGGHREGSAPAELEGRAP